MLKCWYWLTSCWNCFEWFSIWMILQLVIVSHDFPLVWCSCEDVRWLYKNLWECFRYRPQWFQKDFVVFSNTTITLNQCYILVSLLHICAVCEDIAADYVRWWGGGGTSASMQDRSQLFEQRIDWGGEVDRCSRGWDLGVRVAYAHLPAWAVVIESTTTLQAVLLPASLPSRLMLLDTSQLPRKLFLGHEFAQDLGSFLSH